MKKLIVLAVAVGLLFAIGCTKAEESPTTPVAPTSTPQPLPTNTTLTGFENGTTSFTIAGVNASLYSGNDSAIGGTSSVTSFNVVAPGSTGSYAVGLTATVHTGLLLTSDNTYAGMSALYTHCGYVTVTLEFASPVSISASTTLGYDFGANLTGSEWQHKVYFYATNGDYAMLSSWMMLYAPYVPNEFTLSALVVPSGETHTVNSVLTNLKKIVFVTRGRAPDNSTNYNLELYFDNIKLITY